MRRTRSVRHGFAQVPPDRHMRASAAWHSVCTDLTHRPPVWGAMARKKIGTDENVIDAGRAESSKDPADPEVLEEFEDAQKLGGSGARQLERRLKEHTSTGPILSGGDIDADWERDDVGEECVAGDNPTPDQSVVEDLGEAVGVTQEEGKPLRTAEERHPRRGPVDSPDQRRGSTPPRKR